MLSFLRRSSSTSRLTLTPPSPRPDRSGLALVLIVKNEERHITEWARFHKAAGVAHVYAYDNGSTDQTVPLLGAALAEQVTVLPWEFGALHTRGGVELHAQMLANAHAIMNFSAQYRWMSWIDADEFLVPTRHASLSEALAGLPEGVSLSLPWHNFGRSGHDRRPEGGTLENYTRRTANPMSAKRGICNFKPVFDPAAARHISVHSVDTGTGETLNDAGRTVALKDRTAQDFLSTELIQLNHYYSRSTEDVEEKIGRGVFPASKLSEHGRRVMRNLENIEADTVEDRAALSFLDRIGLTPSSLLA